MTLNLLCGTGYCLPRPSRLLHVGCRFNNVDVLGCRITVQWYRDIRKVFQNGMLLLSLLFKYLSYLHVFHSAPNSLSGIQLSWKWPQKMSTCEFWLIVCCACVCSHVIFTDVVRCRAAARRSFASVNVVWSTLCNGCDTDASQCWSTHTNTAYSCRCWTDRHRWNAAKTSG